MPFLHHCQREDNINDRVQKILEGLADSEGRIDKGIATKTLNSTPFFVLAPEASFEDVWVYLDKMRVIDYNRGDGYLQIPKRDAA